MQDQDVLMQEYGALLIPIGKGHADVALGHIAAVPSPNRNWNRNPNSNS